MSSPRKHDSFLFCRGSMSCFSWHQRGSTQVSICWSKIFTEARTRLSAWREISLPAVLESLLLLTEVSPKYIASFRNLFEYKNHSQVFDQKWNFVVPSYCCTLNSALQATTPHPALTPAAYRAMQLIYGFLELPHSLHWDKSSFLNLNRYYSDHQRAL